MKKLKEFYAKNKKSCIFAIVVAGCAIAYCCGFELSPDAIIDKICAIVGC